MTINDVMLFVLLAVYFLGVSLLNEPFDPAARKLPSVVCTVFDGASMLCTTAFGT